MQTLHIHILSTPKALAALRRDQVPVALAGQETDAAFDGINYFVKWPIQGEGKPPRLAEWNVAPECFVVLQPVRVLKRCFEKSPKQLAEALLRATGKWKEAKTK